MPVDEATRLVTATSLSHASAPIEVEVSGDGLTFNTGWLRDATDRQTVVGLLWRSLDAANGIEVVLVYEPHADAVGPIDDGIGWLTESFSSQTEAVLQFMASPDFAGQVRAAVDASLGGDEPAV